VPLALINRNEPITRGKSFETEIKYFTSIHWAKPKGLTAGQQNAKGSYRGMRKKLAIGKNVHRHFAERKVLTGTSKTNSDNERYEMEVGTCYKYLRH